MKNTFMLSWFARLTGKHSTTDVDNMPVSRPISGSGIPPALVWQVLARADARRFEWECDVSCWRSRLSVQEARHASGGGIFCLRGARRPVISGGVGRVVFVRVPAP